MRFLKNTSIIILIIGNDLEGINHFINLVSYYSIIPHYLPYSVTSASLGLTSGTNTLDMWHRKPYTG